MLHLILKTYKSSIVFSLSPHQQTPESLMPWGRLFEQVIRLELPKEAVPEDLEERERCEWWKAKKWAYATLGKLFHRLVVLFILFADAHLTLSRYGNPSQLPSTMKKEYAVFSQHFITVYAPEIFNLYLNQIDRYNSGQTWLSKKSLYHVISFYTEWSVVLPSELPFTHWLQKHQA